MIGQRVGQNYRIVDELGAGGMGVVYLAEDERLGRRLALKVLPVSFTQDPDRVRRFEQEARAASALNHPNIITIYEIGQDHELHFIAAEFIVGETLRKRISSTRLRLIEALDIAIQCAAALQAAHEAGIAHRDIKPDNIMLRPDGYVKVLDFGLAKLTEKSQTSDLEGETKSLLETQPGMMLGTVAYMSPEQARGQRVDTRTDIFSLGIVLYEMLTGFRPFSGETTSDMIAALLVAEPAPMSELLPNVPAELERIVARMLAKDREARYQTAEELLNDLKSVKSRIETSGQSLNFSDEKETAILSSSPESVKDAPATVSFSGALNPTGNYETNLTPVATREVADRTSRMRRGSQVHAQSQRSWGWRLLLPGLILLAVALAGGLAASRYLRQSDVIDSIAVLPFVNEGSDPDVEYLSEGVTEELINGLSKHPELNVTSRNSVIRYRGREADARTVGRELNVKAVLLGRITRRGDELMINAELVDTRNGQQIWGERFRRKSSDLISLQEEIAGKISGKLKYRLSQDQMDDLANGGTTDPEAYHLYLKGRYFWNQGTPESIRKADEYFEAAVARDPSYARAMAGCAASHASGSNGGDPSREMAKAKSGASTALKANDSVVGAHLTLAEVNWRFDWDFATAEKEFKRAIELDPKNALTHQRYAGFLAAMGRGREAQAEIGRARELDPLSTEVNQTEAMLSYYSGRYDQAISRWQKTLELDRNFAPAYNGLGLAYERTGKTREAVLAFLRARKLMGDQNDSLSRLHSAFSARGSEGFWRAYLDQLQQKARSQYVSKTYIAALQTRLGELDQAISTLEQAVREKDGAVVELKVEPVFEPLRSNSKFEILLAQIGLK